MSEKIEYTSIWDKLKMSAISKIIRKNTIWQFQEKNQLNFSKHLNYFSNI